MLTRVPLLLASLFAAACSDDVVPASIDFAPVNAKATALDSGPRARPEVGEPPVCVSIEHGAMQIGSSDHDELRDVLVTATGEILVAGYEHGTYGALPVFASRGTVLALAPDLGGFEQRAILDTDGSDSFESLAIAPDTGTIWLAARSNGHLANLDSRGAFDFVIGDLRAAGGFRPLARGNDSTAEYPRRLAVAPDGFLAVAGDELRTSPDHAIWINPFVATYMTADASVAPQWSMTHHTATNEMLRALDISTDAIVVGGGSTEGEDAGMFVSLRDRDALLRWTRRLSTFDTDLVTAVALLPDGDVVWAGSSSSQLGAEHHGRADVVVGRLDGTTGATQWTVQFGTAGDDRATDLALDADGRIHVTATMAAHTDGVERGDTDAALLVLDPSGDLLLHEAWSSAANDQPNAVTVDACGGIVVTGYTDGDLAGAPHGGRDGFVVVTRVAE